MEQKERDAQRAVGNMEEFIVDITIPIRVTVPVSMRVDAVNEADAVEKAKTVHDIFPDRQLLKEAVLNIDKKQPFIKRDDNTLRLDEEVGLTYTAHPARPQAMTAAGMAGDSSESSG